MLVLKRGTYSRTQKGQFVVSISTSVKSSLSMFGTPPTCCVAWTHLLAGDANLSKKGWKKALLSL